MKHHIKYKVGILFIGLLFFGTCFTPLSSPQSIDEIEISFYPPVIIGQILFAPMYSFTTYLIDYTGAVNHTWESNFFPGEAVCWLGNGTILRTIKTKEFGLGGSGGGIQKVLWDGTIAWDFRYDTNGDLSHHDIKVLPNGNVLMIAWETKTSTEAIASGRDPNTVISDTFMPSHIIEIHQTGPTSGDIVWEWHVWDHLIQDYDSLKENYGVVEQNPGLVDINYGGELVKSDWLHTNSIDYNEDFDQILLSIRNFNEIWVIDHSTTIAEAASHSGGNSGKGGDLLYRWGNPAAYKIGNNTDQKLFGQHDATWIDKGCPGAGHILVFNNGVGRPEGSYSTVDEIAPPVDAEGTYFLEHDSAYGPEDLEWRYIGNPPSSFYSYGISGAERLKDGNTLICNGVDGRFFEVIPDGTTVWQYVNPYPIPLSNQVFKIIYIPPEEPSEEEPNLNCNGSLSWSSIQPKQTVEGTFEVQNIGELKSSLNWEINTSSISWGTWSFTPEYGENLTPEDGLITVYVSVIAPDEKNKEFTGYIRVGNKDNPQDFDIVPVYLKTPKNTSFILKSLILCQLFERFPNVFPILRHLMGY
ncbi:MAG TPA: aryl-sulfate sulfotransferase [Candidatus Thermoplasmatota archaeon]|nr:aryl-sulfate sulfotransferase [Candidatus Thermoplasmatota archaeon]